MPLFTPPQVTAIKNAQMAQSPLVLLGGAAATVMKGRGALQDIDQMSVLKPIVKWAYECTTVRDIVPALRRAFQEAASGVPGPVFVELPLDVLYPVTEMYPQVGRPHAPAHTAFAHHHFSRPAPACYRLRLPAAVCLPACRARLPAYHRNASCKCVLTSVSLFALSVVSRCGVCRPACTNACAPRR